jgi:hypothetical protein
MDLRCSHSWKCQGMADASRSIQGMSDKNYLVRILGSVFYIHRVVKGDDLSERQRGHDLDDMWV